MEIKSCIYGILIVMGIYIVIKAYQKTLKESFTSIEKKDDYADIEKRTTSALIKAKQSIDINKTRENLENIIDNMKELSRIGILYELVAFAKGSMDTDAIKKAGDTIFSLEQINKATASSLEYLDGQH